MLEDTKIILNITFFNNMSNKVQDIANESLKDVARGLEYIN